MGYLLFFLLHPQFLHSVQTLATRQDEVAQIYWTGIDLIRRLYATASTYTRFWAYGTYVQAIIFSLFTSFALWLLLAFGRNRTGLLAILRQANLAGIQGVYFFFWLATITIFLYLTLLSPINAMTPRHISPAWPFATFIPILLLRFVSKGRQWRQLGLVGIVFLSSVAMVYLSYARRQPSLALDPFDVLVIDIVHDGLLPRIIRQIPDETLMFAADQVYLLAYPEAWLPQLDQNSAYISDLSYSNTIEGQEQITELIATSLGVEVKQAAGKFDGGTVFEGEAP